MTGSVMLIRVRTCNVGLAGHRGGLEGGDHQPDQISWGDGLHLWVDPRRSPL